MKRNWEIVLGIFAGLILLAGAVWVRSENKYKFFVVQSGSMEPSIRIGDIIAIKKQAEYIKGEVITFTTSDGRTVTHRVYSKNDKNYVTKGDANRSEDNGLVSKNQVMGKVVTVIPKLGYLSTFSRSTGGFVTLIIIPALILMAMEFWHLLRK